MRPLDDLSFWFRNPRIAIGHERSLSFQVFSIDDVLGLDETRLSVRESGNDLVVHAEGLTNAGGTLQAPGKFDAIVRSIMSGVEIDAKAEHPVPLKAMKTLVHGLEPGSVDHLGSRTGSCPPEDETLIWDPYWTPGGVAFLYRDDRVTAFGSKDIGVRPKRYYFGARTGRFVAELIYEEDAASWATSIEVPTWWVEFDTQVDAAIERYATWLEGVDGLVGWDVRSDVPAWARDLRLVVTLHGEHWTGYVFNTFSEMAETLRRITDWIPGRHVLAYLPGHCGRYYRSYPGDEPGERLGGREGFLRLLETAEGLGAHVMPMFGAHGVNASRYARWRDAVVTDRYGFVPELLNLPDWDSDRAGEGQQLFLNLGEQGFREHLLETLASQVERYGLDAVFLDTVHWRPNDPRHDMWQGLVKLMSELKARFPGVLWSSEGAHARQMRFFPLVQLELYEGQRVAHPGFLYRYVRTFDHLDTGAPGLGSSGVHERGFHGFHEPEDRPHHLPALAIVDDTMRDYLDVVERVCRAAVTRDPMA